MPIGLLFWVLWLLWAIGSFADWGGWRFGLDAGNGLMLVLFGLLAWNAFGPPLRKS